MPLFPAASPPADDPGRYAGGHTRAETLEGGDPEISIGDGTFAYLVHNVHNHDILETGTVDTRGW